MSLVAYASSDEGEISDAEETTEIPIDKKKQQNNFNKSKSDKHNEEVKDRFRSTASNNSGTQDSSPIEDDEYDILPNQAAGLLLPPPKNVTQTANQSILPTEDRQTTSVLSGTFISSSMLSDPFQKNFTGNNIFEQIPVDGEQDEIWFIQKL